MADDWGAKVCECVFNWLLNAVLPLQVSTMLDGGRTSFFAFPLESLL